MDPTLQRLIINIVFPECFPIQMHFFPSISRYYSLFPSISIYFHPFPSISTIHGPHGLTCFHLFCSKILWFFDGASGARWPRTCPRNGRHGDGHLVVTMQGGYLSIYLSFYLLYPSGIHPSIYLIWIWLWLWNYDYEYDVEYDDICIDWKTWSY